MRSWGETWWNHRKPRGWQLLTARFWTDVEQIWWTPSSQLPCSWWNWHELTPQSNSPSAFLYPTAWRLPQRGAKDIFFFRTLKMLVHCFSCWNKRGPKVSRSGFSSFTLMYNGEEKYLPGCLFYQETGKSIWSIWSRSECSFQLLWARSSCI